MQKLYFLRHGVAYDWEDWKGDSDETRPLTDAGIKAMEHEAKALRKMGIKLDAIISSPLERAHRTAKLVAREFDMKVKKNDLLKPGFNRDALAQLVSDFASLDTIMIVGHEPDFSTTITALIGGGRVDMQKGGLACVTLTSQQPPEGTLESLLTPALLGGQIKQKSKGK